MPDYADVGHRPHAVHAGETPEFKITHGPESIDVTLDTWGPQEFMGPMLDYLQSNWGEDPSDIGRSHAPDDPWLMYHQYLDACFGGRTLQQVLEGITFWFTVDGVTRAMTHEMVRARFAAFMQHGGRDNDWRHRDWTMPDTIRRAAGPSLPNPAPWDGLPMGERRRVKAEWLKEHMTEEFTSGRCVTEQQPLDNIISSYNGRFEGRFGLNEVIRKYLEDGKALYAALVDAGIPWQDARRLLPIGTQTYIHGIFNFISLRDFLANRMEFIMDWEINCVAQLMYREVLMKCPPLIGKYLGSHSDRQRKAAFAKLESWPPDYKYPPTIEQESLPRTHRPEQMPFWVLAQSSLDGGPVKWIATNGAYPHDHPDAPKPR
jgi:thymidylate synthase ThyX